jgi:hypothetical protein
VRLLDTNALSEILKRRPHPGFLRRLAAAPADALATSAICAFELRHGCHGHPQGAALWARIAREVLARVRILPVDAEVAVRAGDVHAALAARRIPIGLEDVLIGATALVQGAEVVTRNVRHLSRIPGLRVVDWWA